MSGTVILSAADAAQLNADIGSIGIGGALSATATSYIIELTNDLVLTAPVAPISLANGDVLTIEGANAGNDRLTAQIDGDGAFPGFTVSAGVLDLSNLSLTGLVAAGGTHSLSGGGAIFVGASGTVNVANVNFSGDVARGGTAAGGAVFVAPGGSFSLTGGAVSGSGNSPGNAFFIQGNNAVTLANTTITGAIADAAGAGLGAGAGTVITEGSVTLSSASHYTGGTEILNELTLLDAQAAGTGAISFSATQFESLSIASGAVPLNVIAGFAPGPAPVGATADFIDFESIGAPASVSLGTGNHLTVAGASAIVT
jgi:filamentous hemagglutinin